MNIDIKAPIKLKIKSAIESDESNEINHEKKGKRGRPRKNPVVIPETPTINAPAKKRGRKKKIEPTQSIVNQEPIQINKTQTCHSFITKNYIVQLRVKSSDLEKIQKQFINKTLQIGYKPPTSINANEQTNTNFDEYDKLLNGLDIPLPAFDLKPYLNDQSNSIETSNQLPSTVVFYNKPTIAVSPENVPIALFSDNEEISQNGHSNQRAEFPKFYRNTSNILLPLLNLSSGKWPATSNYPCWNCTAYFTGTPIGYVEGENNGMVNWESRNFCSFECSACYTRVRNNDIDFWIKYSILNIQYQKVYGLSPTHRIKIPPPPEQSLIIFGGKLTFEQYHNYHKHEMVVEIYKLPIMPVLLHIEEISKSTDINKIIKNNQNKNDTAPKNQLKLVTQKKNSRYIPIDPLKLQKAEENLKQKNQERIQSNYSLDNCFVKN